MFTRENIEDELNRLLNDRRNNDVPYDMKNTESDFLPDMNYKEKVDVEASINSDKKVAILLVPSTFNSKNKAACAYSRVGEENTKEYNGI